MGRREGGGEGKCSNNDTVYIYSHGIHDGVMLVSTWELAHNKWSSSHCGWSGMGTSPGVWWNGDTVPSLVWFGLEVFLQCTIINKVSPIVFSYTHT